MIVISGALVLVALVLLVLGLTLQNLTFVYGSIGVSLVSFVFLVIGILQRRGEELPAVGPAAPAVVEDPPAAADPTPTPALVMPAARTASGRGRATSAPQEPGEPEQGSAAVGSAVVLVVPGRPRYHVAGCRYLSGRPVEHVDLELARDRYTACGVCRPEENLAALAAAGPAPADEVIDSGVPGAEDAGADLTREPVSAPGRPQAAVRTTRSRTSAQVPPVAPAPSSRRTRQAAVAPATAAPETAVPAAVPDKPPARRGRVVVIPERGRYHTAQCRFVRDALGTEELTKAQAHKQGYQACGVCKP